MTEQKHGFSLLHDIVLLFLKKNFPLFLLYDNILKKDQVFVEMTWTYKYMSCPVVDLLVIS